MPNDPVIHCLLQDFNKFTCFLEHGGQDTNYKLNITNSTALFIM